MKIVFASNFLNHHQIPLGEALNWLPDIDFTFLATETLPQERINMGYHTASNFSFNLFDAKSTETMVKAETICYEADVVIIGSAPDMLIRRRVRDNKLVFHYSEHFFKDGMLAHPGDIRYSIRKHTGNRAKNVWMLCASAYTALDCRKIFAYPGKTVKWGYFPETKNYQADELIARKKSAAPRLLWVGRYLAWKHPDDFVEICRRLQEDGISFSADMIGSGELEKLLKNEIETSGLNNRVTMHGPMKPEEVRSFMEKASVFLFTSDHREGWGAVLNEAMNSGCAVVAADEAGATRFLIHHGENGLIYRNGNLQELYDYTKALLSEDGLKERFGRAAYSTIIEEWNAGVAADRLYVLTTAMLESKPLPCWESGPLSVAK